MVAWQGVAKIRKQFQVPTLLLDATLPAQPLLQVYHPQVEVIADIKAAMPAHTRIRQVLGAPTSSSKLDDEKHLDSMRRCILQRWIETGRGPTLVICQQKVEDYLAAMRTAGEHHAGALQQHRRAGRFQGGAAGHADRAHRAGAAGHGGAGGGAVGAAADRGHGAGGRLRLVRTGQARHPPARRARDQDLRRPHPDPFVEMIRWQVHEGELVQALGRARGVNRTAATPLDIDLLFDTCLPITVDEVVLWRPPSLLMRRRPRASC